MEIVQVKSAVTFEDLRPKDRHLIWPRELTHDDYHAAEEAFIAYYASVPGIHSILRFGSVSIPGLSDLDFLVVLDTGYRHLAKTSFGLEPYCDTMRYILLHPQLSVPLSVALRFYEFFPVNKLVTVWGKEMIPSIPDPSCCDIVAANHLLDSLFLAFPRAYWNLLAAKTLDIRYCISCLNVFRIYAGLIHAATGVTGEEISKLCDKIVAFRESFFLLSKKDAFATLEQLLEKALIQTYAIVFAANDHFANEVPESIAGRECSYNSPSLLSTFCPMKEPAESVAKTLKSLRDHKKLRLFLPPLWAAHLQAYALKNGPVSTYIRSQLHNTEGHGALQNSWRFGNRIGLLNRYATILEDHRVPAVSVPLFGYRLHIPQTFFQRIRNFSRKVGRAWHRRAGGKKQHG